MFASRILLCALAAGAVSAAVPVETTDAGCPASGAAMLQRKKDKEVVRLEKAKSKKQRNGRLSRRSVAPTSATAWVASSFSDCVQCPSGSMQIRSVECLRIFDGAAEAEKQCAGYPKPPATKACDCAELPCNSNLTHACLEPAGCPVDSDLDTDFLEIGCFNRAPGHEAPGASFGNSYDYTCMNYSGDVPCKSGVPFYSMRSNSMTPSLCYEFCTGKGLDIFALVAGVECRCGAAQVNQNARSHHIDSRHLDFNPLVLSPHTDDMDLCPLRVFRYAGHYEEGGVPYGLTQLLESDSEYLRSIFAGHLVEHLEDAPDGQKDPATTPEPGLAQTGGEQTPEGYNRDCWPSNCGPGRGPWQDRVTSPPAGIHERYYEYVVIPYHFEDGLDDVRKEAFRVAVRRWHRQSCIVLVEKNAADITRPYIKVGNYDSGSCYLSGMGWPGFWGSSPSYSRINLGWCNDMSAVGNMVHEIAHAIGMNHEHKRADAAQEYNGHGPHLIMHWQNIDAGWLSQYTPDYKSYIGSTNQGADDPFSGYAPYDYQSIMHYPRGDAYDTDPPENEGLMGNRKHLTAGDVEQILDVYQCVELPTWSDPTDCSFEDHCYWTNQGELAWVVHSGGTPSSNTGPNNAAEGAHYLYVEASGSGNPSKTAIYESPALDATASYTLTFEYHMLGSAMGSLDVEVADTRGTFSSVWSEAGTQGNAWHKASLDITAAVAVRFVAVTGGDDLKQSTTGNNCRNHTRRNDNHPNDNHNNDNHHNDNHHNDNNHNDNYHNDYYHNDYYHNDNYHNDYYHNDYYHNDYYHNDNYHNDNHNDDKHQHLDRHFH
eukprot:s176_g15.t1